MVKDIRSMITNSIEKEFPAKKEGNTIEDNISKDSSRPRHWSGINNPRVVRVSRSFGGKDRHSKVCTIRGLRDRRVRLSVPTAIKLYDLQDRLGLNQPSKVVDWLLDAAKYEIDELPPLQMPQGNFDQFPPSVVVSREINGLQSSLDSFVDGKIKYGRDDGSHSSPTGKEVFKINDSVTEKYQKPPPKSIYWNQNAPLRSKCKEVAQDNTKEESFWIKRNEQENQGPEVHNAQVSSHNPLLRANDSSYSGLLSNVMLPYNPFHHWGHSNFPLSSLGSLGYSIQAEDPHNYNVASMPSPLSLPPASQLLLYPSATPSSFFSPLTAQVECNPRQISHLQMLSSTSQDLFANPPNLINTPIRPLRLDITPTSSLSKQP